MSQIEAWRESPSLRLLVDDVRMLAPLGEMVIQADVRGGMVHDARIAACRLAHGVDTLLTIDRDFSWFPSLTIQNPFVRSA